jgi:hypothetical protein
MKTKAFITGIAALLLATGAHAVEYNCGENTVQIDREESKVTHGTVTRQGHPGSLYSASVTIKVDASKSVDQRFPVIRYDVEKDKLTVNGKRCKGPNR